VIRGPRTRPDLSRMKLLLDPASLSAPTSAEEIKRLDRRACLFILALLSARVAYAAIFAVNPAGDEAYYWDWGRRLDIGYYSKPPLIAWLHALVDLLGGGTLLAMRSAAAVLGSLSLWLFYRLVSDLFDTRTAWIALLAAALAPANAALSFFLTIDAPLMVCWSASLILFWRWSARRAGGGTLACLAIVLGLGHLSKQMMMVFPLLALAYLAAAQATRPLLRHPSLHLALWGSYLALIPPLAWNARNDWITFRHTGHHFETAVAEGGIGAAIAVRLGNFLSFAATQLGVLGPAIGTILICACFASLLRLRSVSEPVRYLVYFSAIPVVGMFVVALRQEMQPNWAAVFYVGGGALAAAWYRGQVDLPQPPRSWRRLYPVALLLSLLLSLYFYLAGPAFALAGKPGHRADPERRLRGHDQVASAFEEVRRTQPDSESLFLVALGHRDLASHLAFGLPDQPRVYHWHEAGRILSQYDLWPDPAADGHLGSDALFLAFGAGPLPHALQEAFESTENLGEFSVEFGYDREFRYAVYRGRSLQSWPAANLAPTAP